MAIQPSYFTPEDGSVSTADLAFIAVRSLKISLTAATTVTAGAVCSVANPEGVSLLIVGAQFRPTVADDDESINFGIANNGSTSASNIFTGADATVLTPQASTPLLSEPVVWGTSQFLTGTIGAIGDSSLAGFAGSLYVQYVPA